MSDRNSIRVNTSIAPIDRAGITELVVQRIKDLLASGELQAGSKLPPERELADMFNISRPSLRTALKALSVMGVIRAKPGAGTYIAESLPEIFHEPMQFMALINHTSVEELFEARRIIESGLAELAAERATLEDIESMEAEINEMKATVNDPANFLKHDILFHQIIGQASNNSLMIKVMDTLAELLFQIRRQTVNNASDLHEAVDWHRKIVDAIRKHDSKKAKDMVSAHLRAAQESWAHESKSDTTAKIGIGTNKISKAQVRP